MKFKLKKSQVAQAIKWGKDHECPIESHGGVITYSFTQTGIGTAEVASCTCGEKLDLTDYDLW